MWCKNYSITYKMTTPWQLYQHAIVLFLRYTPQGIQITMTLSMHLITGIINRTELWVACWFFLKHILFLNPKLCTMLSLSMYSAFITAFYLQYEQALSIHKNTLSWSHTHPNIQTHYTKHIEFPMMKTRASPWQRHSTSPFHSACFKRWEDGRQQERNRV